MAPPGPMRRPGLAAHTPLPVCAGTHRPAATCRSPPRRRGDDLPLAATYALVHKALRRSISRARGRPRCGSGTPPGAYAPGSHRCTQMRTGRAMSGTAHSPRSLKRKKPSACRRTASLIGILYGELLQAIRQIACEAQAVSSVCPALPIAPTTAGPAWSPARMVRMIPACAVNLQRRRQTLLEPQRGVQRTHGVIFMGDGSPEDRPESVSQ